MAEYCLRWNNHQPNLVTVFSELLNSEALVDVTLATDGQFIHAHKLVLSACSAYFKDLFGSNPCKHPIVFLKDIRFEDLRTVVDFIYKGEVNVTQDRLQDVLRTAESLKIKGLADRPLSFEEHSSQTRGHPLSSAFSSQRSSLNDSREQLHNLDAEDGVDSRASSSPPTYKKRKITTQENSESVLGNCEETRPVTDNLEKDEETVINPLPETIGDSELSNPSEVKKIKKEDESSHPSEVLPEYQESRAADAMLLLQGSSSETEGGPSASGSSATNNIRGEIASSILGSHSQGNLNWSLSFGHWWARVLPALAQHHHQQHSSQSPPALATHSPYLARHRSSTSSSTSANTTRPPDSSATKGSTNYTRARGGSSSSGGGSGGGGCSGGGGGGSSSTSREGSPASGAQMYVGSLDQLALVSALGKEISPQMVQALQAVASRRESFSSAAKLYSVSVTTLWRYFKKLGLPENSPK